MTSRIGYGHPPKHSQFKKGQSGNPKGRPKGSKNFRAQVAELQKQKVTISENGRRRSRPVIEVLLKRILMQALQGDPKAIQQVLNLMITYGDQDDVEAGSPPPLVEDSEIIRRTLARLARATK